MTTLDWLVIAAYAAAMLGVGWYYSGRNETADDYNLGGRRMNPLAIGLSLFATLTSALSYLALPGEMIKNGPMALAQLLSYPLIVVVVGWGLIPFIMRQSATSAYEMLERRLGLSVRLVGSLMFLSMRLAWMASILFATSDKVIAPLLGLGPWETLLAACVMCLVTIIYTSQGGLRAVVVTDAMQSLIMLGGAALVIIIISIELGGVSAWWPREWVAHWAPPKFWFDSSSRMTFLGITTTAFAWYVCTYGSDQMAIQRWLSTRNESAARWSLITSLGTEAVVTLLLGAAGLAVFGYFTAHPSQFPESKDLLSGTDRLFPRFVLVGLPSGVTGIVIAAVLAAAMSSLSSGMNSSCAVITEDFIVRFRNTPLTDASRVRLGQVISVGVGVLAILLSMLVSQIEGNLLDLCFRVVNLMVAPLFVLFFLALFVPWSTTLGALAAALASVSTALSISFSKSLGLGEISILWITPGSFLVGISVGGILSVLPIGPRSKTLPKR